MEPFSSQVSGRSSVVFLIGDHVDVITLGYVLYFAGVPFKAWMMNK